MRHVLRKGTQVEKETVHGTGLDELGDLPGAHLSAWLNLLVHVRLRPGVPENVLAVAAGAKSKPVHASRQKLLAQAKREIAEEQLQQRQRERPREKQRHPQMPRQSVNQSPKAKQKHRRGREAKEVSANKLAEPEEQLHQEAGREDVQEASQRSLEGERYEGIALGQHDPNGNQEAPLRVELAYLIFWAFGLLKNLRRECLAYALGAQLLFKRMCLWALQLAQGSPN